MNRSDLEAAFSPVLHTIAEQSRVAEDFIDKDVYRIYVTTLWANVVLDPDDVGIGEEDLEILHEVLNDIIAKVLGSGQGIRDSFQFVNSKSGEQAMHSAHLTNNHKDLLLYFSSMILDPEGHKRWMERVSKNPSR
jgi:hypothetical protein